MSEEQRDERREGGEGDRSSGNRGNGQGVPPEEVDASMAPESTEEASSDEPVDAPRPGVPVSREEFERLKSEATEHEQSMTQEDEPDGD